MELALDGIHRHQRLGQRAREAARAFLATTRATAQVRGVEFELARPFRSDPIAAFQRVLHDVDDALGDSRLLLAWDEVPDMIAGIADGEGIPAATRSLALLRRYRESPDAPCAGC